MKLLENAPNYEKDNCTQPFEVTATLANSAILYDSPTLDGILSWAVIAEVTQGRGLPDTAEPYFIPLPLQRLWTCPDTLAPLWNATQFFPLEESVQHTVFWHKRGYRPELIKRKKMRGIEKPHNPSFRTGPLKEYRIPMPRQSCLQWRAYGVGDMECIMQLLKTVGYLGKKRTQGFGTIANWNIQKITEIDYFHNGQFIKSFPIDYPNIPEPPSGVTFSRYEAGWTPPYWYAGLYRPCIL